jgi:hypothetical protein
VKRVLALLAGGLGVGAFLRRRRSRHAPLTAASPAEELRARLAVADGRVAEQEPEHGQAPQPSDLDGRREDLHERARRSIDELS